MRVRQKGDWLIAKIGDQRVMMSTEKVHYIGVSEVGARIWELIETPQEIEAVCAQLRTEYAISPEVCRAEVDAFVSELVENGAATLSPQTSAP